MGIALGRLAWSLYLTLSIICFADIIVAKPIKRKKKKIEEFSLATTDTKQTSKKSLELVTDDTESETADDMEDKTKKRLKKSQIRKLQNQGEAKLPQADLAAKFKPLLVLSSSISVIDNKVSPRPRLAVSSALVGVRADQGAIFGDLTAIVSTTGSYLRTAYFGSQFSDNSKFQMGRMGIGGAENLATSGVDAPGNVGIVDGLVLSGSGDWLGGKSGISLGVANGIRGEIGATELSGVSSKSLAGFMNFSQTIEFLKVAGALGVDKNHVSVSDVATTPTNEARIRDMNFFELSLGGHWKVIQVVSSMREEVHLEEQTLSGVVPSENEKALDPERKISTKTLGLNFSLDQWGASNIFAAGDGLSMGIAGSVKTNDTFSQMASTSVVGAEIRYKYLGLTFELAAGSLRQEIAQTAKTGKFATFSATCVIAN